ncbi:MAG: hypothetical protein ACO1OF_14650 [Adhaeribacter sp.]
MLLLLKQIETGSNTLATTRPDFIRLQVKYYGINPTLANRIL